MIIVFLILNFFLHVKHVSDWGLNFLYHSTPSSSNVSLKHHLTNPKQHNVIGLKRLYLFIFNI